MSPPVLRHPLQKVDFKLLACLDALLAQRQVSAAARALDMDQPSMSAALARLRELFDDPLFTRVGQGMEPTPRALALAGPVRELLRGADALLHEAERALGERVAGEFRLLCGADFIATAVVPVLAAALERHMPGLRLDVLPPNPRGVLAMYAQGAIDLGVGWLPRPPESLYRAVLFRDAWAVILRRGHPLARTGLDATRYAQAVHLQVSPSGSGSYGRLVDAALARTGLHRTIGLTVPHFEAAAPVVAASGLVAVVPLAVARAAALRHDIEVHAPPMGLPPLEIALHWHASTRRSALHRMVRRLLLEHFAGRGAAAGDAAA